MTFPFSIKYSAQLDENYASDRNKETLEFIEDFITQKTGDDIVIKDNKLTFSLNFSNGADGTQISLFPLKKEFSLSLTKETELY